MEEEFTLTLKLENYSKAGSEITNSSMEDQSKKICTTKANSRQSMMETKVLFENMLNMAKAHASIAMEQDTKVNGMKTTRMTELQYTTQIRCDVTLIIKWVKLLARNLSSFLEELLSKLIIILTMKNFKKSAMVSIKQASSEI
jgi:hypothetical protein